MIQVIFFLVGYLQLSMALMIQVIFLVVASSVGGTAHQVKLEETNTDVSEGISLSNTQKKVGVTGKRVPNMLLEDVEKKIVDLTLKAEELTASSSRPPETGSKKGHKSKKDKGRYWPRLL